MTIKEAAEKYRIPDETTPEGLCERFPYHMDASIVNYGRYVLLSAYIIDWANKYSGCEYMAAVYEHTDGDLTCEGKIKLVAVSGEERFIDDGHAILWAMGKCGGQS